MLAIYLMDVVQVVKTSALGGMKMNKTVTFTGGDEQLIKDIIAYQKEHNLKHFVDAVRHLCQSGLKKNINVNINL